MFKKHRVYTHKRMLDAAILVLASYRTRSGKYILKVCWQNRRGLDLGIKEYVAVVPHEIKNWYEL